MHIVSLVHAIILFIMSAWGYLSSTTPSVTALIPAFIGVGLVACYPGLRKENKWAAHMAAVLTLLVFTGLFKPLSGAIAREDTLAVFRVVIMLVSTAVALVYFVKRFVDARKAQRET